MSIGEIYDSAPKKNVSFVRFEVRVRKHGMDPDIALMRKVNEKGHLKKRFPVEFKKKIYRILEDLWLKGEGPVKVSRKYGYSSGWVSNVKYGVRHTEVHKQFSKDHPGVVKPPKRRNNRIAKKR